MCFSCEPVGPNQGTDWVPLQIDWYLCPSDQYFHHTATADATMPDGSKKPAYFPLSYCDNYNLFGRAIIGRPGEFTPVKHSSIKRASDMVIYSEQGDDENRHDEGWEMEDWNIPSATQGHMRHFQIRHISGSNVAYLDGHLQYAKFINKGPQYGLPPFPWAIIPDYKSAAMGGIKNQTGPFDAQYDNFVRPAPITTKP